MTTLQTIPVHFDQEAHTYTNTETGEMYRGITGTLIHRLNPDKYAGIPAATLQAAANKGSVIHSQLELIETLGVDPATEEGKNYVQELDKMGLQFLASEHTVSDLQHYATNIDVIYEAGEGEVCCGPTPEQEGEGQPVLVLRCGHRDVAEDAVHPLGDGVQQHPPPVIPEFGRPP